MLKIDGINKVYPGGIQALRNVSLELGNGLFGLLGPNGAGKTTLMRTLATVQLPDSGTIYLGNVDLVHDPGQARKRIGYLPQESGVYPRVSAIEMLDYIASLKGFVGKQRKNLVLEQLEKVNLLDVGNQRLETFSGGMKQRFGIAAALLGKPELVIVDEPTAGLDPLEKRRFQLMLSQCAEECVLILSSHIVDDIEGLCQAMAIMNQGQIVLKGNTNELLKSLNGKVWEFDAELDELDQCMLSYRILSWQPRQGRLKLRVYAASSSELDTEAVKAVAPCLEDLYTFHIDEQK